MDWKYPEIPKTMHFYWGLNTPVSYLQMLTIKSFRLLNPDWVINLWVPISPFKETHSWSTNEQKVEYTGLDYYDEMIKYVNHVFVTDFEKIGFRNDVSEVYKSDFIRLYILYHEGGFWSDIDILYIKPMSELNLDSGIIQGGSYSLNMGVVYNDPVGYIGIGFMFSKAKNKYFEALLNSALENLNTAQYESIGVGLYRKLFHSIYAIQHKFKGITFANIPMDVVYPFEWHQVDKIFNSTEDLTTNRTIGIHWFNGATDAKNFQNLLTPNNLDEIIQSTIVRYVKQINKEWSEIN
jgi:mannosyltransferase OCH1-like enzyme